MSDKPNERRHPAHRTWKGIHTSMNRQKLAASGRKRAKQRKKETR